MEKGFKLTYIQFDTLAKDRSVRLKNNMQKVADKGGFGKSFKEKTEQFDKHIQQKKEKQNNKDHKVEKENKIDRGLSL